MSAYELQDHEIALSLALVVSGLTVRYVSHDGWPAASGLTDYKAIIGATPMGGTLGILGGSADYQNVTVSLATLGASADSDLDPGIQLGRVDYRDCGAYARLITTLVEETGTLEVHVDRDPTPFGMGAGGFIHIARECIQVTGTAGTGTIIDPWRFTLGARGARDTLPQQHYVHDVTPMRPWVTSEPFAWRWRRAWLYARARRPGGTFGDLVTVMPCFVGEAPVIDTGEVTVMSVELLPLTAILDKKLAGAGNAVRLLQGYHYFADGIGSTVEHAQRVLSGTIYDDRVTAPDAIASAKLTAPTAPYDRAADVTLPSGHPRHTRLDVGVDLAAEPQNPHVGAGQFQLSAGLPTFATVAGTRAASTEAIELHRVDMITPPEPGTAGLLRWPSEALDLINAAWVPGTHTGATGAWADVKVGDDPDRGPHIQIRFNVEQRNGPVFLIFWSGDWVPGDQGDPPFDWSTGAPVGHADRRRRLFYGLTSGRPPTPRIWPIAASCTGSGRSMPGVIAPCVSSTGRSGAGRRPTTRAASGTSWWTRTCLSRLGAPPPWRSATPSEASAARRHAASSAPRRWPRATPWRFTRTTARRCPALATGATASPSRSPPRCASRTAQTRSFCSRCCTATAAGW